MRFRRMLLLVFLATGVPAGAQAPDAPQPVPAFEESIDVQAVNLEAVVTDSRGRRVTGLTVEDFKLFVDGAETPITFFSPVEEERQRHIGNIGEVPALERLVEDSSSYYLVGPARLSIAARLVPGGYQAAKVA